MSVNIEIPPFLSHLKVDHRGYPVPFFVQWIDGRPDFRLLDVGKWKICMDNRLCSICGLKLPKDFHYFIAGPQGLKNKTSTDTPMHHDCAMFSIEACPHLYYGKADRRSGDANYQKAIDYSGDRHMIFEKPEEIYLVKSDKYKAINHDGETYIRYRPVSSKKFIYVNNILTPA